MSLSHEEEFGDGVDEDEPCVQLPNERAWNRTSKVGTEDEVIFGVKQQE